MKRKETAKVYQRLSKKKCFRERDWSAMLKYGQAVAYDDDREATASFGKIRHLCNLNIIRLWKAGLE